MNPHDTKRQHVHDEFIVEQVLATPLVRYFMGFFLRQATSLTNQLTLLLVSVVLKKFQKHIITVASSFTDGNKKRTQQQTACNWIEKHLKSWSHSWFTANLGLKILY